MADSDNKENTGAKVILLVEDDKFLREIAGNKLEEEGFIIHSAQNGDEGFALLANDVMPDVVVLDLILPGMSGFEVLEKLKSNDKYKEIPVLILSNLGQEEDIEKAKKLGATDYMVKAHFSFAEIIKKIHSVIG
jgi:DNA-binding response OmpR family regulator